MVGSDLDLDWPMPSQTQAKPPTTDIVERLRAHANGDHVRGCEGRMYSCTCGYDEKTEPLLAQAADEIERLLRHLQAAEAEVVRLRGELSVALNRLQNELDRAPVGVAVRQYR